MAQQAGQGQTGDNTALLKVGRVVARQGSKINVLPRLGSRAHHLGRFQTRLDKELGKTWTGSALHWVPSGKLEIGFNSFPPTPPALF